MPISNPQPRCWLDRLVVISIESGPQPGSKFANSSRLVGKWRVIPDRPPSCGQIAPTPLIAGNGRGGICGHQVGHFRRAVASLEGGAVKEGGSPPAPNWSLADRPATQTCPNPPSTLISTPVMYD